MIQMQESAQHAALPDDVVLISGRLFFISENKLVERMI